jgi:5'-nucleotidase
MSPPPVILLTNDDGINAAGLRMLRDAIEPLGEVVVVAPALQQSATSHAITIARPLRHVEHGPRLHSIDGTPADCIYLALFEKRFLPRPPDLVVSGINHGLNTGTSVYYSGTVAGAREAALRNIPAIAYSHAGGADAPFLKDAVREMTRSVLETLGAPGLRAPGHALLLNVNFPTNAPRGVKVTRVGRQVYEEEVIPRLDPGGREYFWIGGRVVDYGDVPGSDTQTVDDGFASVTPLALEPTQEAHLGVAAYVAEQGGALLSGAPNSEVG